MVWESDGHKLNIGIKDQWYTIGIDCPHEKDKDCPSSTDGDCAVGQAIEDAQLDGVLGEVEHIRSPIAIEWGWEDEELWVRIKS